MRNGILWDTPFLDVGGTNDVKESLSSLVDKKRNLVKYYRMGLVIFH